MRLRFWGVKSNNFLVRKVDVVKMLNGNVTRTLARAYVLSFVDANVARTLARADISSFIGANVARTFATATVRKANCTVQSYFAYCSNV